MRRAAPLIRPKFKPAAELRPDEQRRARRHRLFDQACILAGSTTLYCAIHDLSSTGAKLEIGENSWSSRLQIEAHPAKRDHYGANCMAW